MTWLTSSAIRLAVLIVAVRVVVARHHGPAPLTNNPGVNELRHCLQPLARWEGARP
jgi:hypothetical protein